MHKTDSKGVMDTEKNERMGIGEGRHGTGTTQSDKKEEIIILWTCDEERGKLSGEGDHAGHYTGSKETRKTKSTMDGQREKMDWKIIGQFTEEDGRQEGME